jgi:hypothetical protein
MSPPGRPADEPVWTVDQAAAYFAAGGVPIGPRHLAAIIRDIRAAARAAGADDRLVPAGETPSGELGGRGKALYRVSELMELHRDLARWVAAVPDPGPGGDQATPPGPAPGGGAGSGSSGTGGRA